MEEIMTPENNAPVQTIQTWWDELSFQSKDAYQLRENGELVLKPRDGFKERVIGTFTLDNAAVVFKALTDKFPEVAAKVTELETEWNATEDKLKLLGKIERMKDYLQHTNAIGDFHALEHTVAEMEKVINKHADANYQLRLALIQEAEKLAGEDNFKDNAQKFRDFTEQWKQIGYTDKQRSDELWTRLETAKTKFFDRKRANQEEHTKEMMQNLDIKMELVEKAEQLTNSEDWKSTTEVFKNLMEEWKKTGRTTPGKNEELWAKFIGAKNNFYDRKKQHFDAIAVEQENSIAQKSTLIEQAEALKESTDWGNTAQAFNNLMDEWKKTGRVPSEKGEELWQRFHAAREHFYQAKRQHFETVKVGLEDNLAQKIALAKRAESLQHSNQWRDATTEMNELMDEWKKIGPVPREHSEPLWERFLKARKGFFERKDANRTFRKQKAEQQVASRIQQSKDFIKTLEDELKEEEEKLVDFKNGLENITPGHKAAELKAHLEKLIQQTEQNIKNKTKKLASVKQQFDELGNVAAKEETVSDTEEQEAGEA